MEDVARVFLFDFWRHAGEFSGETPRVFAEIQQAFKDRLFLELAGTNARRTEATGFRVLGMVLADVPLDVAHALKRYVRGYMMRQRAPPAPQAAPPPRRAPSPEIPVHDAEDEEEHSMSLSLSSSSSPQTSSSPFLSPLPSFSHRPEAASFGGGGGGREGTASIPDYFEDDWRDIEASRRRREAEAEADAIYQRTYEELEQQKKRERQEWQEEQQRRRMNRRRRQPVAVVPSAPAPTATTTTTTGDVFASIPAFQTDMWQQDENLMSQLAIQPPDRLRAIGKSSFMRHIAAKARDSY